MNYFSHHLLNQKIGIIYILVDRAIKLTHKVFHKENLDLVFNILVKNDYPAKFIEKFIKIKNSNATHNKYYVSSSVKYYIVLCSCLASLMLVCITIVMIRAALHFSIHPKEYL